MAEEVKKAEPKEKEEGKSQRQKDLEQLRKTRIPPGVATPSAAYPSRPGYKRRVVADRPGRLEKFLRGSWTFVSEDDLDEQNPGRLKAGMREGQDSRVSQVIGSNRDNSPLVGYLMEIPEELYDEDQAVKMERVDELEGALRQGMDADGSSRPGEDGRYVPSHTPIKIKKGH